MKEKRKPADRPSGYWLLANSSSRGVTVFLVLGFMGVFAIVLGTISSYFLMQGRYGQALYAREIALHVAEAGLEYYRWFLAHNPVIMTDGTGLVSPYTYAVNDPEGGSLGSATVSATLNLQCGVVQWADLTSVGAADVNPTYARRLSVRYIRPSSAEYSYILSGFVGAGRPPTTRGPYHSNGGVRMDAVHNSDVTSSVATWTCDAGTGCPSTQAGVFGAGSTPALWTYPVSTITVPFSASGVNFTDLRTKAQSGGGIYYAAASGSLNERGYHLVFNAAGTAAFCRVTSTNEEESYSSQYGNTTEPSIITGETLLGTYAVPSACSLLFFEDRVWVEGTVNGKVTVVAATPDSGTTPDAYLNNNIYYAAYDGTDGITVIAERNVLLPLVVPDTMEIHGIFVASNGHYGRDHFRDWQVASQYDQYITRDTLITVGTVVSNGRTGTSWQCSGSYCSGFATRYDYYDQQLAFSPPPFTPVASTDYKVTLWREQ